MEGGYNIQGNIEHIPAFIETGDSLEVNHLLWAVLFEVVVYSEGEVELRWK